MSFTISDPDDAIADLTITATSTNQQVVANSAIVISGTGAARTVTVASTNNQLGTARIIITVSDDVATASTSFNVSVRKRGRAPRNLDAKSHGRHARVTWDAPEDSSDVRGYDGGR